MEEVHDVVVATLREMGFGAAPSRTILIQKGYFVGLKYRFDGGYAIRMGLRTQFRPAFFIELTAAEIGNYAPKDGKNRVSGGEIEGQSRGFSFQ